ncbi:MAG: SDR family oxidoreductase [Kordiimonadaceae bacterium]|jgi:nucleoside-diphosphate-sugar epimerase|nr:SDR family oxidoreductase [Kordiimonadaceae bacterium]MBT6036752.1 SDR family oxidoreductase [Kordiimonadaceae bacterium]MBT6328368.1 SDR family oxidoreductase [Kordiimonadaceae bacterium]MBT7583180.1 SDR family oxidoreductase [Kordiimonadaceae bacterium]
MKLFCFGLGYTASHLISELSPSSWQFSGTHKSAGDILFDGSTALVNAGEHLKDVTHLLISIPPNAGQIDPVLHHHKEQILNMPHLKWIGYLSATSVYGDHNGDWVDENTIPEPTESRGQNRLDAEQLWQSLDLPVHIFRLGGIYGPDRNQIGAVKDNSAKKIIKKNHTFSRIHIDDISAALIASIESPSPNAIYNIVDDLPTSSADVLDFICQLVNEPKIEGIAFEDANLSDMAKSFYSDNKRVRNDLTKAKLNWQPKFANYKQGYADILEKLEQGLL